MTTPTPTQQWTRHRFRANSPDYRPVTFPTPGPYWCSGFGGDEDDDSAYSTVIVYLPRGADPCDWWPEAENIDSEDVAEIVFTDRFPRPKWWAGEGREWSKP